MRTIASTICAALVLMGCDQLSSPQNYDDCILKNMHGVDSDVGAAQIRDSCRKKFPEGIEYRHKVRELEPIELLDLTGRGGLSYGNRYSGSMYNGNESVTVTSIKAKVTTRTGEVETAREYQVSTNIPPLTTADFGFDIIAGDKGSHYSWEIVGGRGYGD